MPSCYLPRLLSETIKELPHDKALVLVGARQAGKRTLLEKLFCGSRTRYLSGDETKDIALLTSLTSQADLRVLLTGLDTLVIEEAQHIPSRGLLLKRLVDAQTGTRIVFTASSTLGLPSDTNESAAGRFFKEELWPVSIEELAKHSSWLEVVQALPTRLVFGNYFCALNPDASTKEKLKVLIDTILFKDILGTQEIRKREVFLRLLKLLAQNIGSVLSFDCLGRQCGLSSATVANYVDFLEKAFVVKTLASYSRNLANELKKSKKVYFCDLGIRNAVIENFSAFASRGDSERGALWENYFVIERFKHHAYKETGAKLFFWRDKQKHEVDLIEVMPDASMQAFECKTKDETVRAPKAFTEKYSRCTFQVATMNNFYRYYD